MVTFGEPEPEGLTSDGKRKGGWHKKAAATWRAKERAKEGKNSRPREIKPRVATKRFAPVEHPCPRCFAPVRDGICLGAFSMANGGLHNER